MFAKPVVTCMTQQLETLIVVLPQAQPLKTFLRIGFAPSVE